MKHVTVTLIIVIQACSLLSAQGYLRNDAVTTHVSGITINEISAWSNPFDYNADGVAEGGDKDEFIEIVNSSDEAINMHNWTIATGKEDDMDLFTFPDTTILPQTALVLFCRRPEDISNFDPGPANIALSAGDNNFRLANFNPEAVALKNTHNLYISVHWLEGVVNSGFLSSNPILVGEDVAIDDNWYEGQSQCRMPDYCGTWCQHPVIPGLVNWSNDNPTITLTDPMASPARINGQDIPFHGPVSAVSESAEQVAGPFALHQNYPNPFNGQTQIRFRVSTAGNTPSEAKLVIFDMTGRKVKTLFSGPLSVGSHIMTWNGLNESNQVVASGMYFYMLSSPEYSEMRKMVVRK